MKFLLAVILILSLFIPQVTLAEDEDPCQELKCRKGSGWDLPCYEPNVGPPVCARCSENKYQDESDHVGMCHECRNCAALGRLTRTECQVDANTACSICEDEDHFGGECDSDPIAPCHSCKHCSEDEYELELECSDYHARMRKEAEEEEERMKNKLIEKEEEKEKMAKKRDRDIIVGVVVVFVIVIIIIVLIYGLGCYKWNDGRRGPDEPPREPLMCVQDAMEHGIEETTLSQQPAPSVHTLCSETSEASGPVVDKDPVELKEQLPILPPPPDYNR